MNIFEKLEGIHANLARDVKKRFSTSSYEIKRPLPIGKSKNNELVKDKLGQK